MSSHSQALNEVGADKSRISKGASWRDTVLQLYLGSTHGDVSKHEYSS